MNDLCRSSGKGFEDLHVREGVGEALEVVTRAVDAERRSLLVLIVKDRVGEEGAKLLDVFVGDMVGEFCDMILPSRVPE